MQVIELSITEDACCEMSSTADDCCTSHSDDDSGCHSENNSDTSKNSCQDHCPQCHTCHGCYMPLFVSDFDAKDNLLAQINSKKAFEYNSIFINNNFFNIWQPPKIA